MADKRKHRNQTTIVVRSGYELVGKKLKANKNGDDVIVTLGDNCRVAGCIIEDDTGLMKAHRDGIQPISKGAEINGQFFGAKSTGLELTDNRITSNGMLQGIFSSDGMYTNVTITGNTVKTLSPHAIRLDGVMSGLVSGNEANTILGNLRIGGNHPLGFYVDSFKDHTYEDILLFDGVDNRNNGIGVSKFDWFKFRSLSKAIPWINFEQHITALMSAYERATDAPIPSNPVHDFESKSLSDTISQNEGGYRSFNRGRPADAGNSKLPIDITVKGLLDAGKLPRGNRARIWAAGKYQIIPPTLKLAVNAGVVGLSEVYSEEVQERIFSDYLLILKRRHVFEYITRGSNLFAAQLALSKEWASIANPRTGRSYYSKNKADKAHTSVAEVTDALVNASEGYTHYLSTGLSPVESFRKCLHFPRT